jgi:hypothetical protein
MTRLRESLIDDSVKLLLDIDVIVTLENEVNAILYQQLMNRHLPARSIGSEAI